MSSTAKVPAFDKQEEEEFAWNEETAPHAARAKAPNRGAPHAVPGGPHDPHGDRHAKKAEGMKGRSHLPAHEIKGGAGWAGPEKKGERELIDETEPLKFDPKDPGEFAAPGVDEPGVDE